MTIQDVEKFVKQLKSPDAGTNGGAPVDKLLTELQKRTADAGADSGAE